MAVNVIGSAIGSVTPSTTSVGGGGNTRGVSQPDFREALQNFREAEAKPAVNPASQLKFSNHAVERMQLRGIHFDAQQLEKINQAIQKAETKGAKNTLLVTDNSALIVSVKDKTVVTVMDRQNIKDNVFTNIDSTVLV
jgi:flagellar operon protein